MQKSSKTAVIVQARYGSTRLPGKVLLPLGEETVLWHVLKRCQRIKADVVVCAVPEGDEAVAIEAIRAGAKVAYGPEDDVLGRYLLAATDVGANKILRVTSDCPLIDPEICNEVLELSGVLDYASNVTPRMWPKGLDCEAFSITALQTADRKATDPRDREHVGPWMQRNLENKTLLGPGVRGRWVLDYPEDYYFLSALFEYLPPFASFKEIQQTLDEHSEISSLNALRAI